MLTIRINDNHVFLNNNSPFSKWIFQVKRCLVPLKQPEVFRERFTFSIIEFPPCLTGTLPLLKHTCAPIRVCNHMGAHSNRSIFGSLFPLKLNSSTYYVKYNTNPIGPLRSAITDCSDYVILLFSKCCQS